MEPNTKTRETEIEKVNGTRERERESERVSELS